MPFSDWPAPLARGVYRSHVRSNRGHRIMFCVDRNGCMVASCQVFRTDDSAEVAAMLERRLNAADPPSAPEPEPEQREQRRKASG